MQVDHRAGKDFLRDLSGTLIRYDGNRISLLPALLCKSSGYLWFLRHHLKIEEDIFFSMARTFFSTKEEEMLAKQFARWEMERKDERLHIGSSSIITRWERELRILTV
jgi:hemerythrin-like domain-containing protein